MKYDILIAGVGGQGTVLASRLLAMAAMETGYFVRTAETIGMAQRGGSVVSHVRMHSKESSPVIPFGHADLLIGFEPSEAARNLKRLAAGGKCIVNSRFITPVIASLGAKTYSEQKICDYIKDNVPGTIFTDAYAIARREGVLKAINVLVLGAVSAEGMLPFDPDTIQKVIIDNLPEKYRELNIKAFRTGLEYKKVN